MKTMLDKCAVAGDITQAIDRRGAWSCAVTVIGGAENTAVKLQSCATVDGTFEDFKTLIPSADASANQYKGFVVDLSGAGNFIKVVGTTMATAVFGDCDYDVKEVAIKAGEIPSGGGATLYYWINSLGEPMYLNVNISPNNQDEFELVKLVVGKREGTVEKSNFARDGDIYKRISDTEFSVTSYAEIIYTRDSTKDIILW